MASIVVISRCPSRPIGSTQERTALPSTWTVQAPHCAMPQPNFVPVMPRISRSTHSNGVSAGASKAFCSPLIMSVVAIGFSILRRRSAIDSKARREVVRTFELGDVQRARRNGRSRREIADPQSVVLVVRGGVVRLHRREIPVEFVDDKRRGVFQVLPEVPLKITWLGSALTREVA